jgi:alcohol dehydrogenase
MDLPDFVLQHAVKIRFGWGAMNGVSAEIEDLGASRALVVCDPGIVQIGLAERLLGILSKGNVAAAVFSDVSANPRDNECEQAALAAKEFGADVLVGIGGGSAMDTAKTAAALLTNGGSARDWEAPTVLATLLAPVLCLPTTAGTGSEVTSVAVITDSDRHYKMSLLDPRLAPRVAVVDPQVTVSLPPSLTASTGMDALTHAIEAYTCRLAEPITDAVALAATSLIVGSLRQAVEHGDDEQARTDMMLGSLMAGIAFGNTDVGSVHSMAESIGGLYDTPHGVANAVFLARVVEFNIPASTGKFARIAVALGVERRGSSDGDLALEGVATVRELARAVGIPRFSELPGVNPADFEALARTAADHVCTPSNCRDIAYPDYLDLFRAAYVNDGGSPSPGPGAGAPE